MGVCLSGVYMCPHGCGCVRGWVGKHTHVYVAVWLRGCVNHLSPN